MQTIERLIAGKIASKGLLSSLFILLKVALFILLCGGIYTQLDKYKPVEWTAYFMAIDSFTLIIASIGLFFLMVLNWGLEAWKWHILINKIEKHSFSKSVQAILSSVAFGFNTPNRIGEFSGRLIFTQRKNIFKAIGLSFIGSFCQLAITLILGCISLFVYLDMTSNELISNNIIVLSVITTLAICAIFLINWKNIFSLRKQKRLKELVDVIVAWKPRLYISVFLLSLCRYLVYTFQFILLLQIFGIEVANWKKGITISTMYLFQTISPSISLIDLGIRQNLAYFLFDPLSTNMMGITLATFSIWLINLAFPAIVGYGIILKTKLFENED